MPPIGLSMLGASPGSQFAAVAIGPPPAPAGANFPLRQDRLFTAREAHVACQREFASYPRREPRIEAMDATGARAKTGSMPGSARHRRGDLIGFPLSGILADYKEAERIPAEIRTAMVESTETSSLKWEQPGGFCRAKEEFNGVDVVVSYLINKGDNYENHDNSTSNCVDPPEYVRPCARWDEHGKSRHSPLQHGRCGRSYRNQTQECFWEYASSHRA
jgi:hypothetical protein